jgi:ribulose-5-phosphate 4-epimerase/fuculose-1-phosphate aldolase
LHFFNSHFAAQGAILMNHGLLTTGHTVDEAGFMFGLLDRGCQIQLEVEAACAGNPDLKKKIISDEEAAYNFKMASDPDSLYAEMQPDLDFILETDGYDVVCKGAENMKID